MFARVVRSRKFSFHPGTLISGLLVSCGTGDLTLPRDSQVAQLLAISGDEQQGVTGSQLDHPLVVEARDRSGMLISGAAIVFSFDGSVDGGKLDPGTVITDQTGQAAALVRLGKNSGTQTVDARPDAGVGDGLARFRLTALQPNNGDDDDDPQGGGGGAGGGGGDDDDNEDDSGNKGKDGKGKGKGKGHGGGD